MKLSLTWGWTMKKQAVVTAEASRKAAAMLAALGELDGASCWITLHNEYQCFFDDYADDGIATLRRLRDEGKVISVNVRENPEAIALIPPEAPEARRDFENGVRIYILTKKGM